MGEHPGSGTCERHGVLRCPACVPVRTDVTPRPKPRTDGELREKADRRG